MREKSGLQMSGPSLNIRGLACEMNKKKNTACGSPAVLDLTEGFNAQRKWYKVVLAFISSL